ncbi:chorion peroxidase [Caerostris extrusa]|uniref:Chorion peroxidase n=1 Tax=Caerostris extrusa TaxID=172846 RepID=A0AAV4N8V2_CAEEX|nr:chorion peroxidase [Caerostris extrusa]
MKGLTLQPAQKFDPYLVPDVRNFLYREVVIMASKATRAISSTVGVEIKKFEDLDRFMTGERRKKLQDIYHFIISSLVTDTIFEHHGETGSFSLDQVESLKKTTFSKVICENTHIHEIQRYVFRFPSAGNPVTHCNELPDLDLSAWEDFGHKKKNKHRTYNDTPS